MIKNSSKTTKKTDTAKVVSGFITGNSKIEFVAIEETNSLICLQDGATVEFKNLSPYHYQVLWQFYFKDRGARALLGNWPIPLERQVELYIFHIIQNLDEEPTYPSNKFDISYIKSGEVMLVPRWIRTIEIKDQEKKPQGIIKKFQNFLQERILKVPIPQHQLTTKKVGFPIQTIQASTIDDFENLFNQIFPDFKDENFEIIQNVHQAFDSEGETVFRVKVRRI